jgi:5-methyltetrahydrofolate--homocysteine methyltransferase
MNPIDSLFQAVVDGNEPGAMAGVESSLQASFPADQIMRQGLIAAMTEVGQRFEAGEYYLPEMVMAARAMKSALLLLKPALLQGGLRATGTVAIGTVQGDLHDIGKNMVGMMLEGAGFEVLDLGTDVSPARFVEAVQNEHVNILSLSALLTTTMPNMAKTIEALKAAGMRDKVKVLVGGAPVTEEYAQKAGADGYSSDAGGAARLAVGFMGEGYGP